MIVTGGAAFDNLSTDDKENVSTGPSRPGENLWRKQGCGDRPDQRSEFSALYADAPRGSLQDFWTTTRHLSEAGHIAPLATRGIGGQATLDSVVYDAETTHGGSGGPVLGLNGEVQAINAAILTDFGGSNLGIPAAAARRLLDQVIAQSTP